MSELMQMREDGMSNREIADSLGVSYTCIKNYLGPQPKGMRKYRSKGVVYGRVQNQPEPEPEVEPCLVIGNRVIIATGLAYEYEINCSTQTLTMYKPGDRNIRPMTWDLSFDDIDQVISELQAISRNISKCKNTSEMW